MTNSIAFVFPGQGSQAVGMLAELAQAHPLIIDTFAEASKALGYDLWQLVLNGPESELNQTEVTQPALLAAGVALWRLWVSLKGPLPALMAGHSLGEYTALVCAGALEYPAAVKLVAERGRFMQEAVPAGQGAMAAIIGLSDEQVMAVCKQAADSNQIVAPANYNTIGQVVIAGGTAAVERAVILAKEAGAKLTKILPVSVPSHCALMQPAATQLAKSLAHVSIHTPTIPVIHNVDVKSHQDVQAIRKALVQQLDHPVRWVETVQDFAKQGVSLIIECGPGKVLAGLNKRIADQVNTLSLNTPEQLQQALAAAHNLQGNILAA